MPRARDLRPGMDRQETLKVIQGVLSKKRVLEELARLRIARG